MTKTRNSGRKPVKPEYSAEKNLSNQMDAAAALYKKDRTLQAIAEELSLNSIKVRKLLITAGVYQSDIADTVQQTFQSFRTTQDYKTAVSSTMAALNLSRPSVTSYLPYEKGVYFPEDADAANISTGAERQRHYRAASALKKTPLRRDALELHRCFPGIPVQNAVRLAFYLPAEEGQGRCVYQGAVD